MKKIASILDYSYPGISPDIWLSDGTLNPVHKDFIVKLLTSFYNSYGLKNPEQWVIDVTVIGSLTTNRYIRTSDFDCHVIVDIDKFIATNMPNASKEEAITYLDNARKTWDRAKILMPFGEHTMELYIEDPNLNPSNTENVGRYSMFQNKWLKDPIYFAQDLDFEESRKDAIEGAKALANELDASFGEIGRQIQRIDELKEVLQAWPEDKRQLYYAKVQHKLDLIEEQLEKSIQIKQDLVDTRHLKQDAFSENEIQFKFLARFHYFSILSNLKTLLEQTGGQVTTQELPLIEKIISQGSIDKKAAGYWLKPNGEVVTLRSDQEHGDYDHSTKMEKFKDGWVRLRGDRNWMNVQFYNLDSPPSAFEDYVLANTPKEMIIDEVVSQRHFTLMGKDVIELGFKDAYQNARKFGERSMVFASETSFKEVRLFGNSLGSAGQYWFDPNGKFYQVDLPAHNHTEWIQQNAGIDSIDQAIKKGWIRACKYSDKGSIYLESLQNLQF